jgi:hypothetical protein
MNLRVPKEDIAFCLEEARKLRAHAAEAEIRRYTEAKAARKPWLSIPEAAAELDVSQGRISQLLVKGVLAHTIIPNRRQRKFVSAADVYAYTPTPSKKTRTKK